MVHLLPRPGVISRSADIVGVPGMCGMTGTSCCIVESMIVVVVVAGLLLGGSWFPILDESVS